MMHWLVGKAIMTLCGLGVVLCVIWAGAPKMGDWPVGGMIALGAWLPLQIWHAKAGRMVHVVVVKAKPDDAANGGA